MKTLLSTLAIIVIAVPSARADQLDDIMANKTLVCGVQANSPPFGYVDPATRTQVGHDVDLCNAIGKAMGVAVQIQPLSTQAKIPQITLGHVDIGIANLAYSKTRGGQIQFSDPYYIARETLVVPASDTRTKITDFKGARIAATTGSTSEVAIRLADAVPVTFQDVGSTYLAVVQKKTVGFVCNRMTAKQLVNKAAASGVKLRMVDEPMALEPIGVGMQLGQPRLLAKINGILANLEQSGEMTRLWNRWVGPGTSYDMVREDHVQPLASIKFQPLP